MHTNKLLAVCVFVIGLGLTLALLWCLEATLVVAAPTADLTVNKLEDTADGICNDDDCSLREAIIAANNNAGADVIYLAEVGTYELTIPGVNEGYGATGDLNIKDDLTIVGQGPGATVIDAKGIDRVFSINASTVVISGVTIMGGASPAGSIGGGIFSGNADLTLTNVAVVSNTSTSGGGGICLTGSDAVLTLGENSLLARNKAGYDGGGLSVSQGARALLGGGRIISNSAVYGGGVYAYQGSVTMSGAQIISNTASWHGGGVFLHSATATLSGGAILSNTAGRYGGGLYASGAFTQTGQSVIGYNTAYTNGGGIYAAYGTVVLNDGQIIHNRVTREGNSWDGGGGIFVAGSNTATLIQTGGSAIIENSASTGGGVYITGEGARVTLSGGQILSNTAYARGGGVYLYGSSTAFTQTGGLIAHNVVTGTGNWDGGGGVGIVQGKATLSGGQILDNDATRGGGLYIYGAGARATLSGGQILSNTAYANGGGVCLDGADAAFTQTGGLIAHNAVTGTGASDGGGGVTILYGKATLNGGQILDNDAPHGGGLYVSWGSVLLDGGQIVSNTAGEGGGMYVDVSTMTLQSGQIGHNTVITGGGGIYIRTGSVIAQSGQIIDNWARYGGGVYVDNGSIAGDASLEGVHVISNIAKGGGGGVYVASGSATVERGQIVDNISERGGGVYNLGALSLVNTTVSGNDADAGGAIFNESGTIALTYTTVASNTAPGDFGITAETEDAIQAKNTIIAYNGEYNCSERAVKSNDYNLDSDESCKFEGEHDQKEDPQLAPLAYDLGSLVHAIPEGSSAHDTGECQVDITTDQRGAPRVAPCDMGAYEYGEYYVLTVATDGTGTGTVDPSVGTHIYLVDTEVPITASAGLHSTFAGWSGDLGGSTSPTSIAMDGHKAVTATFTLNTHPLDVNAAGDGSGTVSSTPAGIDCGADCSEIFVEDTVVTLTAEASAGSTFGGWSGAGCSGVGECVVTMDAAQQVTATFTLVPIDNHALTVLKAGDGSGTVSSTPAGIDCGADCSEIFTEGTVVTLTAAASTGSTFGGWSGAGCSGVGDCVVTMDAAKQVTATFTLVPIGSHALTVLKAGDGSGTVSSTPAGIDCGADCSEIFTEGTVVTLAAAAGTGSTFDGWSGAGCSGVGDCVVTMDAAKQVTVTFVTEDYIVFLPFVTGGN